MDLTNGHASKLFTLHLDDWGRLILTDADGQTHAGVEPVRAFPITAPQQGISSVSCDGKELLWIEHLESVAQSTRQVLEKALAQRQFIPILQKVIRVSKTVEPNEWEVITDRGPTTFPLKSDEDIRRLTNHRALIIDAHGIRYLIPDLRVLDHVSRRLLERYL